MTGSEMSKEELNRFEIEKMIEDSLDRDVGKEEAPRIVLQAFQSSTLYDELINDVLTSIEIRRRFDEE